MTQFLDYLTAPHYGFSPIAEYILGNPAHAFAIIGGLWFITTVYTTVQRLK